MCTEKHDLVKNIFPNGLNIDFPQQTWVKKAVHKVETHWLSGKGKVLGAAVNKEGNANSL